MRPKSLKSRYVAPASNPRVRTEEEDDIWGRPPIGYIPGKGRGATPLTGGVSRKDSNAAADFAEHGSDGDKSNDDSEDARALTIYSEIDDKLKSRKRTHTSRKVNRGAHGGTDLEHQSLSNLFKDLRGKLGDLSIEDWAGIADLGVVVKKSKWEREGRLRSDSIIHLKDTGMSGFALELPELLAETKSQAVGTDIDAIDNSRGQKSVNVSEYLASLERDTVDKERQRKIFESLVSTDSRNPLGWISYAQFEYGEGRIKNARNIIAKAAGLVHKEPLIWLEAVKMYPPANAVRWLEMGLSCIPDSKDLWLALLHRLKELRSKDDVEPPETDSESKLTDVVLRATTAMATDPDVWICCVDMIPTKSRSTLLGQAVMKCPDSLDLWLLYIRTMIDNSEALEFNSGDYDEVMKVIGRAVAQVGISIRLQLEKVRLSWISSQCIKVVITEMSDEFSFRDYMEAVILEPRYENLIVPIFNQLQELNMMYHHDELEILKGDIERAKRASFVDVILSYELIVRYLSVDPSHDAFMYAISVNAPGFYAGLPQNEQLANITFISPLYAAFVQHQDTDQAWMTAMLEIQSHLVKSSGVTANSGGLLYTLGESMQRQHVESLTLVASLLIELRCPDKALQILGWLQLPSKLLLVRALLDEGRISEGTAAAESEIIRIEGNYINTASVEGWKPEDRDHLQSLILERTRVPYDYTWLEKWCYKLRTCSGVYYRLISDHLSTSKRALSIALSNIPRDEALLDLLASIEKRITSLGTSGVLHRRFMMLSPPPVRAAAVINGLKTTDENIYALIAAGWLLSLEGNPARGVAWYIKAFEKDRTNADVIIEMMIMCKDVLTSSLIEELKSTFRAPFRTGFYYNRMKGRPDLDDAITEYRKLAL